MKELATFIEIDAKPDVVWRHIIGFRNYADWNPFITAIDGHPVLYGKLHLTMRLKTQDGRNQANHTIAPRITKFEDEHEIRWEHGAWFSWLLTVEHWLRITQRKGGVKVHQCMRVEGLLSTVMKDDYFTMFKTGFEAMNEALKHRVENMEAPRPAGRITESKLSDTIAQANDNRGQGLTAAR